MDISNDNTIAVGQDTPQRIKSGPPFILMSHEQLGNLKEQWEKLHPGMEFTLSGLIAAIRSGKSELPNE